MTLEQYEKLNKHREVINHFHNSGHYPGGDSINHINSILVELGWPNMNAWCGACVADRMKASYNILTEYEKTNGIQTG